MKARVMSCRARRCFQVLFLRFQGYTWKEMQQITELSKSGLDSYSQRMRRIRGLRLTLPYKGGGRLDRCKRGHDLTVARLRVNGERYCLECMRWHNEQRRKATIMSVDKVKITQQLVQDTPALMEHIETRLAEGMIGLHPLRDVYTEEQVEAFIAREKERYAELTGSKLLWTVHARMNAEHFEYTLLYGSGPDTGVPIVGISPIQEIWPVAGA